jgi:hypothetical protein
MSATTTSVPTSMLSFGSNGMANHSSPLARTRPGLCPPRISLVTRAVSPTIPWTPLSTALLYFHSVPISVRLDPISARLDPISARYRWAPASP